MGRAFVSAAVVPRRYLFGACSPLLPLLTGEGRTHHGDILREATKLVETSKVAPILDPRRFTLETILEAYDAIRARSTSGKLVVDITH